jgi:hypothetical protein
MKFRNRRPKSSPTHLFPVHLETAEQTIVRLGHEQAEYVARHVTPL